MLKCAQAIIAFEGDVVSETTALNAMPKYADNNFNNNNNFNMISFAP